MEQLPECEAEDETPPTGPDFEQYIELFNNEIAHFGIPGDPIVVDLPEVFDRSNDLNEVIRMIDDYRASQIEQGLIEPQSVAEEPLPIIEQPSTQYIYGLVMWRVFSEYSTQSTAFTDYQQVISFIQDHIADGAYAWITYVNETHEPIEWSGRVDPTWPFPLLPPSAPGGYATLPSAPFTPLAPLVSSAAAPQSSIAGVVEQQGHEPKVLTALQLYGYAAIRQVINALGFITFQITDAAVPAISDALNRWGLEAKLQQETQNPPGDWNGPTPQEFRDYCADNPDTPACKAHRVY